LAKSDVGRNVGTGLPGRFDVESRRKPLCPGSGTDRLIVLMTELYKAQAARKSPAAAARITLASIYQPGNSRSKGAAAQVAFNQSGGLMMNLTQWMKEKPAIARATMPTRNWVGRKGTLQFS